jgi:predicted aspartyl protease
MRPWCALAVAVVPWHVVAPAAAEIYTWIEAGGGAHYSEGLESVPERYRTNARALGLRNRPATPPSPESPAPREGAARAGSRGGATEIRYVPGERIVVDALLNGDHTVRLLLDTGADRTLISPRALVAAGVSLTRGAISGSLRGVTGATEVNAVVLESLEVGDARVGRLRVLAYEMGLSGHDGLLGRDYLDQFHVAIDSSRGIVTLTPRR